MRDTTASPVARASAARSLLEYYGEEAGSAPAASEMSAEAIDRELAQLEQKQ